MLKIQAHDYFALGSRMADACMVLYMSENHPDDEGRALTVEEKSEIKEDLEKLSKTCSELGLLIAKAGIDRAVNDLPRSSREYSAVTGVVKDELKNQLFLFVPANRAKYYEYDSRYTAANWPNFPRAFVEMIHAGNCIATGEFTASVFHGMRAVEIGIKAIYLCLGLPDPIGRERNWGNLTNGVRTAIENKGSSWPKRDFFFELSGTIVAVKDAWRKNTMHVEISYTEQDAERIFTYVGLFIDKLSAQMDEAGLPLA